MIDDKFAAGSVKILLIMIDIDVALIFKIILIHNTYPVGSDCFTNIEKFATPCPEFLVPGNGLCGRACILSCLVKGGHRFDGSPDFLVNLCHFRQESSFVEGRGKQI